MGTSSSSKGQKGKIQLLPNFAQLDLNEPAIADQNGNQDGDNIDVSTSDITPDPKSEASLQTLTTGDWNSSKRAFNTFLKNRNKSSFKKAAKQYVTNTYKGHRNATVASSNGVIVGTRYVNFLGSLSQEGLDKTIQKYSLLDCKGKSSEEALALIADKLAPVGATNDEAIARMALLSALEELYSKYLKDGNDIDALAKLTEEGIKDSLIEYVSAYIFHKWLYELGVKIETDNISEQRAIALENQIKSFIHAEVENKLGSQATVEIDINHPITKDIIKQIFELAYSTLEK